MASSYIEAQRHGRHDRSVLYRILPCYSWRLASCQWHWMELGSRLHCKTLAVCDEVVVARPRGVGQRCADLARSHRGWEREDSSGGQVAPANHIRWSVRTALYTFPIPIQEPQMAERRFLGGSADAEALRTHCDACQRRSFPSLIAMSVQSLRTCVVAPCIRIHHLQPVDFRAHERRWLELFF